MMTTRTARVGCFALPWLVLGTACGEVSGARNLAEPRLIAGGGIGDGAIDGRVNLHVIDSDTDAPIAGAEVQIGEPGETPKTGVTDSSGLFSLDDDALVGPVTITVVAGDYTVATWFGADGANVTMPLDTDRTPAVPQATLRGTIADWDTLTAPPDHFLVAIVDYSETTEIDADGNNLEQPSGSGGLPGNACIRAPQFSQCEWELNTRAGAVAIFATILDIDTHGTETDADDTTEVVGYAFALDVVVADGGDQSGLVLEQLADGTLVDIGVDLAGAPAGVSDTAALVGLDLGEAGVVMLGFLEDSDSTRITVPELSGDFAGASYRVLAFAGNMNDDPDDETNPMSAIIARGITDLAGDIDVGPWLALPSAIALDGGDYSFTGATDAILHVVDYRDGQGESLWSVALLDGRTHFTLPDVSPSPLPGDPLDLVVTAFDGPIDLTDFSIDDFTDALERTARESKVVTP
jgi:hypothetical protein